MDVLVAMGPLLEQVDRHADEMRDHGRRMFEAWLDTTVGAVDAAR